MKELVAMLSGDLELPLLPLEYSPSPPSHFRSHRKARAKAIKARMVEVHFICQLMEVFLLQPQDYHHFPQNVLAMIVVQQLTSLLTLPTILEPRRRSSKLKRLS